MLTVKRFEPDNTELLEKARSVRRKVFVVEQGFDPQLEFRCDEVSHHYLLCDGRKVVGAARWREVDGNIKLERFAVLKNHRNRGYGKIILLQMLIDVLPLMKPVILHSQIKAVRFYEHNGFVKEGEKFVEAGAEHYKMKFVR
jgi:predicted GNAT family N-acyltransferase